MTSDINYYENDKYIYYNIGWLSHQYEIEIILDGKKYKNCEQRIMEQKALLFNDRETAELIMNETDINNYRRLGRQVKNFNYYIWNRNVDSIIYEVNMAKFQQNPALYDKLVESNNKTLVLCIKNDNLYANGLDVNESIMVPEKEWKGLNRIGKIIMEVRKSFI